MSLSWNRYAIAVATALVAAWGNEALWPAFGRRYPLILFYFAIAVTAGLGGLWPGVLCTTLSGAIAAAVWFNAPSPTTTSRSGDVLAVAMFFVVGLTIAAFSESLKRRTEHERVAREQAERAEREARRLAEELRASEARLATELAATTRLHELSTQLLKEQELGPILQRVLQAAIELVGADTGDVRRYDDARSALTVVARVGSDPPPGSTIASDAICRTALTRRHRVVVEGQQSTPLLDGDGKPVGVLSTYSSRAHEPTERELRLLDLYVQQAERALERTRSLEVERVARRQAEQANSMKDQFLSTVSHELRTPLTAILGWAELLKSGRLPESRREHAVEVIFDNAHQQTRLIDDLLDISGILSGKLRLERADVDLRTVVQAALDVVVPAADAKGLRLLATIEDDPAIWKFYGDAARLQQIVWNLASNAVKFTPNGGTIQVRVRRRAAAVEISVSDTGCGIGREFLPYVFQPFRQADESTTRSHGGLGLGLSIARHIVEAHGGTIHVESEGEGRGATFTVRLPIAAVAVAGETRARDAEGHATPVSDLLPDTGGSLEGVAVLVVDDDEASRDVISTTLEEAGATVLAAQSAEDALEVLERQHVDVLLADVAMPGMDGYSLIQKIRRSRRRAIAGLPALALTSLAGPEDRLNALRAGFDAHAPKPVSGQALTQLIGTLTHSSKVH